MKSLFSFLALTFLFLADPVQCRAMISVEFVSAARAKTLGVTFRTEKNGQAGVRVWVEFKLEGELKKITYVEVQIGEGESRIMSAHLRERQLKPGMATFHFSVFPAYLPQSSVMIVVYGGPRGDVGYRFRVKDFIEPKK